MNAKAEAFARYNEAAVLQMLVEVLPQVAKEIAAPMSSIDKLTVVSTDGAAALPKQVTDNLVQTLELLKTTTGFDVQALLDRFNSAQPTGAAQPASSVPARPTSQTVKTEANGRLP